MTTLLLAGASGLVGQAALRQALGDARVRTVIAPSRRPLPAHARLHNPVVDFDALPADAAWWSADAVICTLGTTIRDAGSRAAFRKIDLDYPLTIARLAQRHGARAFALTSASGANPESRIFYSRIKGELERELAAMGFDSLTIVRPSLLGGERAQRRPAEYLGLKLLSALGPVLPRRYRVVPAEAVAGTMLRAALAARPGVAYVESEAID